LQLLITLSIFELLFHSWQKLPFTCSYVPGQRPLVAIVAGYIAVLCAIMPILSVMIAASSAFAPLFPIYLLNFGAIWFWLRRQRRQGWGESKLLYEDVPAVVTDLGIKDITLVGQPILAAAAFQPASAYPKFTSSQSSPPEAPSSLRQ
jgi:Na+-transporting NADH:ubiquinone oxidoreductase subunit NqrE